MSDRLEEIRGDGHPRSCGYFDSDGVCFGGVFIAHDDEIGSAGSASPCPKCGSVKLRIVCDEGEFVWFGTLERALEKIAWLDTTECGPHRLVSPDHDIAFLLDRVAELEEALRELVEDYDVATREWQGMEGDGADITLAAARRVLGDVS